MKLIELGKDEGHVTTRQLTGEPLTQDERELLGESQYSPLKK